MPKDAKDPTDNSRQQSPRPGENTVIITQSKSGPSGDEGDFSLAPSGEIPDTRTGKRDDTGKDQPVDSTAQQTIDWAGLQQQLTVGEILKVGNRSYSVSKTIGGGGQGQVLLARDLTLGRDVAIKQANLDRKGNTDAEANRTLLREAATIANLEHKNIVDVLSLENMGDSVWIIYKYIRGGNLEERLRPEGDAQKTTLTRDQGVEIVAKIASALQAVHDAGLCHRDVKPANILLDTKGEPYLADFGVVMPLDKAKKPKGAAQCAGTPAYMSPEQARAGLHGDVEVDQRSDIFSLGIVLHEILSGGKKMFISKEQTPKLPELLQQIASETPLPDPVHPTGRIPPELLKICRKALQKDPEKRYQTAAEMGSDLQAYLETIRNAPQNRLNRRKWILSAAATLTAGAGGAYLNQSRTSPKAQSGEAEKSGGSSGSKRGDDDPPLTDREAERIKTAKTEKELEDQLEALRITNVPQTPDATARAFAPMDDFFYEKLPYVKGTQMAVDGREQPVTLDVYLRFIQHNVNNEHFKRYPEVVRSIAPLTTIAQDLLSQACLQKPGQNSKYTYGAPNDTWNSWSTQEQGIWKERVEQGRACADRLVIHYENVLKELPQPQTGLSR